MGLKGRRKKTGKIKSGLSKVCSKTFSHVTGTKISWEVLGTLWIAEYYAFSYCFYAKSAIPPWSCEVFFSLVFDTTVIYVTQLTLYSCTVKLNELILLIRLVSFSLLPLQHEIFVAFKCTQPIQNPHKTKKKFLIQEKIVGYKSFCEFHNKL